MVIPNHRPGLDTNNEQIVIYHIKFLDFFILWFEYDYCSCRVDGVRNNKQPGWLGLGVKGYCI